MNLEVYDVSNDDIELRLNLRVFDPPNLDIEQLGCTVTEAEFINFHCMRIPVICELSKPWAELGLIYMQGRLND